MTELCSSSPFRGLSFPCSVGAGRNRCETEAVKGRTCLLRASRQTSLPSSNPPSPSESEEAYKSQGTSWDCIIPHTNHTFNSYFHINVVLGVMLCRFHPLTDKVGVLVHKVYDAPVIFGVLGCAGRGTAPLRVRKSTPTVSIISSPILAESMRVSALL